jgi:hypothetical protein
MGERALDLLGNQPEFTQHSEILDSEINCIEAIKSVLSSDKSNFNKLNIIRHKISSHHGFEHSILRTK